jgi:hypothetical protein
MSGAVASTHGAGVRLSLSTAWSVVQYAAVLGNAVLANTTVFDSALLSTWSVPPSCQSWIGLTSDRSRREDVGQETGSLPYTLRCFRFLSCFLLQRVLVASESQDNLVARTLRI